MIKNVNCKLLWKKNFFDFRYKRNKVYIGRELMIRCRILGCCRLLEGVCILIRLKKFGKLMMFLILRRKMYGVVFFVDFLLFLVGVCNFEVCKFFYSRWISCLCLIYLRFLM